MKYIVVDESQPGSCWSSRDSAIYLGRRYNPQDVAHEIAHVRLGHNRSYSLMADFLEEREAWMDALRRLPPEEVRVKEVEYGLTSYIRGLTSSQKKVARRMRDEVVAYASKRKEEAR